MILHFIAVRLILKMKLYDDALYFGMLILTCVLGIITAFLYPYPLIRYPLFIILAGALLFFRRKDLSVLISIIRGRSS